MWDPKLVDGSKFVVDEVTLLPLLRELDPKQKLVLSTIGNGATVNKSSVQNRNKINSMKGKSLRSLSHVNWWSLTLVVAGVFSLTVGFISTYRSVYDWIMNDLLEMRTISPMYSIWADPPHLITFSVNIFEAVNHEEFLASDDPNVKLELRDIGAVVYREHIQHVNVTHNANGTMSYKTVRRVEFLEELNEPGILNRTIVVPNFGLLGALSYLHELSFFAKLAFNMMLNSHAEPIFINITVYDFLWNYNSDVITLANKVLPMLVPVRNLGIMQQAYANYEDHVSVRIGKENGFKQFFDMEEYNYQTTVPGFNLNKGDCNATIKGSNEAYLYNKKMDNETIIKYFRKSICQVVPLHYERSSELHGLSVNEYVLKGDSLRRKANLTADCYKGQAENEVLPDGLTDMSKCYFDFPMVLSLPHFFEFEDAPWNDRLMGLSPSLEKHQSKIFAEPSMGLPVKQYARSQVNTYIRDLSGFPAIFQRFSNMVIPIFWGELMMKKPPPFTLFLMRFCVNYLPMIDVIVPVLFVGSGLVLWAVALRMNSSKKTHQLLVR